MPHIFKRIPWSAFHNWRLAIDDLSDAIECQSTELSCASWELHALNTGKNIGNLRYDTHLLP